MKTKILTVPDLNEILLVKLNQVGLTGETIDYNRPLLPQLLDAEVLVTGFSNIDKRIIDSCPNLKLVRQRGIGVDNVDVGYCTSKSIFVTNVPLAIAVSLAEHTLFPIYI
jgi:D-3-phosphoglycerate dehydrogenase